MIDYSKEVPSYKVYSEDKNYIYLPRYYGIEKFGKPIKTYFRGKRSKMKFKGKLREKQVQVAKKCLQDIKTKGGGIISLHTGAGKTVIALYIACQLKVKTLVLRLHMVRIQHPIHLNCFEI